jgi:hypothetical protein
MALGQLAQLLVHDPGKLRECALVAVAPLCEQLGHGLLHRVIRVAF